MKFIDPFLVELLSSISIGKCQVRIYVVRDGDEENEELQWVAIDTSHDGITPIQPHVNRNFILAATVFLESVSY